MDSRKGAKPFLGRKQLKTSTQLYGHSPGLDHGNRGDPRSAQKENHRGAENTEKYFSFHAERGNRRIFPGQRMHPDWQMHRGLPCIHTA